MWAIEGCQGIGRHIANRLVADGEHVVDVPPKLSARTRVFAVPAAQRVRGSLVWPWRIASVRGRGFECSGLRVAHWVADACLRASFCVAPRCSPSAFSLVTPHSCWSVEVPGLHGMQEVSGSSPLSSTQVKCIIRIKKPVIMRPVRGILRGKIHRTMAVWPAATQASSSPDERRLCDLQEVTSPGVALCRVSTCSWLGGKRTGEGEHL